MIKICGYPFNGPRQLDKKFKNIPGVYVVFTNMTLLDVEAAKKIGNKIKSERNKKTDWLTSADGYPINIAFLKVEDKKERLQIKSHLRKCLKPVCGR